MDSQINTVRQEGFFDLFDKQTLAANPGEGNVLNFVARRFNRDQLDL